MKKEILKWLYIIAISACFIFAISCSNDTVTISKDEYSKLKGDTIKSEYPKKIFIQSYFSNAFDRKMEWNIIVGSDNHEYLENNQWNAYCCMHYPDCKLCLSRMKKDTVYIKK